MMHDLLASAIEMTQPCELAVFLNKNQRFILLGSEMMRKLQTSIEYAFHLERRKFQEWFFSSPRVFAKMSRFRE